LISFLKESTEGKKGVGGLVDSAEQGAREAEAEKPNVSFFRGA